MKVHVLDVGQGDCILVQTPEGRNVLVDAGGSQSSGYVLEYLAAQHVEHIDLIVISHVHPDHIGGLPGVLSTFGVSRVLTAEDSKSDALYGGVTTYMERRRIRRRIAKQNDQICLGRGVTGRVLWPSDKSAGSEDDSSIILRIAYKDVSILLTGDIGIGAEGGLLAGNREIKSTILKVARHGSAESTSNEFLQCVQPEYAVISAGIDNPYGCPAGPVLRRINATGAQLLRTDRLGAIIFKTDGHRVMVETSK
jgi:competence protein ComEC